MEEEGVLRNIFFNLIKLNLDSYYHSYLKDILIYYGLQIHDLQIIRFVCKKMV